PAFYTEEAVMVGLESRTSSTVVLPRNPETMEHIQIKNLYPCGEGAGYAGGITSSAIDGVNCANKLLWNLKREIALSLNI
ncbi:MAG: FAD-binding protein, partial [Bacteroidales bacterium]|nr:FAD-binding protein [Bacteroidales bacterium]